MKKTLLTLCLVVWASLLSLQAATNIVLQEGFENGFPTGWTQEYVSRPITLGVDTAAYSWGVESGDSLVYPTGAFSGKRRAYARNSSSDEMRFVTRLVTPVINLQNVFQPQLVFSHAEVAVAGSSDTLKVYYRTSANDYWHPYPDLVFTRNANWKTETATIIAPSSTYQLAFEITENFGRGVVLDDIIVRATPTCQDVDNITATNVHAYDAYLSWNANGAYDHFQAMITKQKVTNFTNIPDSVIVQTIDNIYNPEVTVSGLTPQTTYYAYVRSDCDENASGYTNWVEGSFRTLTVAFLPYTENFNSAIAITGNTSYARPEGWTSGTDLDTESPYVYRANTSSSRQALSVDSTAYLAFNGSFNIASDPIPTDHYAYIASPEISVASLQGAQVDFWATAYDKVSAGVNQYAATLYVGVMTDPADYRSIEVVDSVVIESAYQFKHAYISLDSYTGSGKFIALLSKSDLQNAVYVDNFHVCIPSVPTPNHVKLSAVNPLGFTVAPAIHGADSWNLKVSSAYSRDGQVADSTVLFSATGITAAGKTVALADSSLAGKTVLVYVQAVKAGVAGEWSFPVTLRVPTAIKSYPYTCSFEVSGGQIALASLNNELRTSNATQAVASVFFPVTNFDQTNPNYPRLLSTAPNYNGAHAELCGINNWFVLPQADSVNTLKMVFRYATASGSAGKLQIGVMDDPYDLSTFTPVSEFSTDENAYTRCVIAFDGYQGTGRYIAFRSQDAAAGTQASVNLIDEITVSKLDNCREASNIEVDAHASSATITWNGSNMDGWIIGCSKVRSMMNASYQTVTTPSVTFTNLDQETTYYFTISTICGGDTIQAEDIHKFTTPLGLPFTENFASSSIPSGWTRASVLASQVFNGAALSDYTSNSGWSFSNSSSYCFAPQSGNVAYTEIWGSSAHYWLISPVLYVDVPDSESLELTFDLGLHGYYGSATAGSDDQFMLLVSTDGGNTWSKQNATIWNNKSDGDYALNSLNWEAAQSYSIDFAKYAGHKIQFAFYGESTSSNNDNYFSVDNIILRGADPDCGGLNNLTATATSGSDANIHWTLAGVNPHPALVQISATSSFSTFIYNGEVNGNSLTLNTLAPSTHYYVRARQSCDNDADWKYVDFRTACEAISINSFGTQDFEQSGSADCWTTGFIYNNGAGTAPKQNTVANFGGVLEITKSSTDTTASDGAYAISPELIMSDSISDYQIVFDAASASTEATNVHRLVVGVVTNPSDASYTFERIATINLATAADSLDMKTYVVSLEDYVGDIDGNYGHYIMFLSEAGADSTNYVYIDNVSLEKATGCHQVINLEADSIKVDGARLTWTGNGVSYQIGISNKYIDPTTHASDFIESVVVNGNEYSVTGLEATTTYYAYIRSVCAPGDSSRWSGATRFSTSYGVPFKECWNAAEIDDEEWSKYSSIFVDSVKTENLAPATSSYNVWQIASPSEKSITGMAGNAIRHNLYSTYHQWIMSPVIDMSTAANEDITLSMSVADVPYSSSAADSDDRLGILISADGGTTWYQKDATWFQLNSFGSSAKRIEVNLNKYAGKNIRFAIYDESQASGGDTWVYVDSITITKQAAVCLGVNDLALSLVNDSTIEASWSIYGTPDSVKVLVSSDSQFSTLVDSLYTADTLATFTHLDYNNTYYLRVQQIDCSTTVESSIRMPLTAPYNEGFSASVLPSDWTLMTGKVEDVFNDSIGALQPATTTQAWKINTTSNGLPANHLYGEIYTNTTYQYQWIVSPEVKLQHDAAHMGLIFDLALTDHNKATASVGSDDQEFRVLVSTDGGSTWAASDAWLFANNNASAYQALSDIPAEGERVQLSLDAFIGERIRVAFYKNSTSLTCDNDIHIANVQIREVGDDCADPDSLKAEAVSFTYAQLSWQGNADKQTLIEFAADQTFSGSKVDTVASGLQYRLSSLLPNTTYYVRAWQVCGQNSISGYSNTISFKTSVGIPYTEDFAGSLPNDWERYSGSVASVVAGSALTKVTSSSQGWRYSSLNTILGGDHIYCPRTTTAQWIVSPEIDLTPNTDASVIAFQFDMAVSKTYASPANPNLTAANQALQHFHVLVSTDNGATWTWNNEWLWSTADSADFSYADIPVANGKTYQLDFTRFAGQKIRIALVQGDAKSGGICMNVNNVKLSTLESSCFGVSNIVVNSIDTAANLTLVPADNAPKWEYAYGFAGSELTALATHSVSSTNFQIGGLALNHTYDIYLRSICNEGDTSAWCGPYQFTTPLGLAYDEPFRNTLDNWTRYSGNPDAVFAGSASLASTTAGWTPSSSVSQLGEPHIYCATNTATSYWLVSPAINLMPQAGDKDIWLSFDAALTYSASTSYAPYSCEGHKFIVAVSDDAGATWTAANSWVFGDSTDNYLYSGIPAAEGLSYHLDASRFAGKVIRIAFIKEAAANGSSCISINNLVLDEYTIPCFGADAFSAEVFGNAVRCAISESDSAAAWQYAIGATGFVPSNANAVTVNTPSFTINNLNMSSSYDLYVRSLCGEEDTSAWYGPVALKTAKGIRYEEPFNESTFPSDWKRYSGNLNALSSSSSGWELGRAGYAFTASHLYMNNYYGYYSSTTPRHLVVSPQLDLSNVTKNAIQMSFDLALTAYNGSSAPASTTGQSFEVVVSIDGGQTWLEDPAFTWAETDADYKYSDIPAAGATYTLDLSEYAGEKIQIGFYGIATQSGADADIHIQNLVIDTISGSFCSPVKRLQLVDSTYTSATIAFRAPGIGDALDIEWFYVPEYSLFNPSLAQHADTNVLTITGLQSSMGYDAYARVLCQDSTWADWAGPFTFHTVACAGPTGIKVKTTTLNGATLQFLGSDTKSALGYDYFVTTHDGVLDPSQALHTTTDEASFEMAFTPSQVYDVYVRKICNAVDTSDWAGPYTFHAPYGIRYEDNMNWTTWSSEWSRPNSLTDTTATSSGWSAGRAGYVFTDSHVYCNNYSSYTRFMTSPAIDLSNIPSTATIQLSFDMALTAYYSTAAPSSTPNQSFYVLINNGTGWKTSQGFSWLSNGGDYSYAAIPATGETYILDLSAYAGQSIQIGFYATSVSGDNDIHIQNFVLDTLGGGSANCLGIQSIDVRNVGLNSADLNFTYKSDSAVQVVYYEVAIDQAFATIVASDTVRGKSTTIKNLDASTKFYVRAREICGVDEESAFSRTVSFTTNYGVRYTEDFDETTGYEDWTFSDQTAASLFGGSPLSTKSSSYWARTTTAQSFQTPYIRMNIYSTRQAWIFSPVIDLTPNSGQALLFAVDLAESAYTSGTSVSAPSYSTDDQFIIAVSEDGGSTWLRSNATVWNNGATHDYALSSITETPSRITLDFSKYAGKKIQIGFYGESTVAGTDNWLMFDNVDLNATEAYDYVDTICSGSDYVGYGFNLSADDLTPGVYSFSHISQSLDSVVHLKLIVKDSPVITYSATICEGETYTDHGYNLQPTESGVYKRRLVATNGCDSLIYLNLTVHPITRVETDMDVCAGTSITIGGKTYYNNAVAHDTLSSLVTGCDSIVTYYLNFTDQATLNTEMDRVACAGEYYSDDLFSVNEAGTYVKTTTSVTGCDSVVTLHLYVADPSGIAYYTVYTDELPFSFNGQELIAKGTPEGIYDFTVESTCGTATLRVALLQPSALDNIGAQSLAVTPNPAKVGEDIQILTDIPYTEDYRLTVYDAVGRLVYATTDRSRTLPGLPAVGYYTVQVRTAGSTYNAKLLVD